MRTLFYVLACICMLFFALNMFCFWIMNDIVWLSFMPVGLLFFFIGVRLEHIDEEVYTREQIHRRKVALSTSRNGILLCIVLLLACLAYFIDKYI